MSFLAAIIIGGGALVGGVIAAEGAKSAASTQAGAAQNAQNISLQEFNTITGQEQPFMQSGYAANNYLGYLMGLPGYENFGQGGGAPAGAMGGGSSGGGSLTGAFNQGGGNFQSGLIGGVGGAGGYAPGGLMVGPNAAHVDPSKYQNLLDSSAAAGGQAAGAAGPARRPGDPRSSGGSQSPGMGFGSLTTPFTAQNWQQLSPMYNFDIQQGRQGVLNANASQQGSLSGAAAKDLMDYNRAAANQSFGQAFNQYQTQQGNIFSRLSGIAQLGQNAAANTGMQGTALAGQAAQSATNIGTAQAAGQIGAANAYSGAISSAMPWLYAGSQTPPPQAWGDATTVPG